MADDPRLELLRRRLQPQRQEAALSRDTATAARDPQVRVESAQEVPDPRASQVPSQRPPQDPRLEQLRRRVQEQQPPRDPRVDSLQVQVDEFKQRYDPSALEPRQWTDKPLEQKPPSRVGQLLRNVFTDPMSGNKPTDALRAIARTPVRALGGMVEGTGQAVQAAQGVVDTAPARAARRTEAMGMPRGRTVTPPPAAAAPDAGGRAIRAGGEAVEGAGSKIRAMFPESKATAQGGTFQPKNPLWWIERGGEFVTQLGVQIGLAAATGGAGPVAQFLAFAAPTVALEGGNAYRSVKDAALERGATPEEAEAYASGSAVLTAAGSTALEGLPFAQFVFKRIPGAERLWGELFAGSLLRRTAGHALTSFGVEGIEEAAQEAWGATIARTVGENPEAFNDIGMRMVAAGVLGGVAGGLAGGVQGPPAPKGFGTPSEDAVRDLIRPEAREARRREASEIASAAVSRAQAAPGGPSAGLGTPEPPQVDPGANAGVNVPHGTPTLRRRVAEAVDPTIRSELESLYTDELTGLGNKAAFRAARARLDADPGMHVAVLDLTKSKAINDDPALGWDKGDERRREVAGLLKEEAQARGIELRNVQFPSGDEFVVWGPDPQQLEELGAAVQRRLPPMQASGVESHIRYGVGGTFAEAESAAQRKKPAEKARYLEPPVEARGVDQKLPPEAVGDSDTYFVHPSSLNLDPDRFQFKDFLTPTGETGALKGVEKWDETRSGIVAAWRDPADGKLYVVNGHQRTNLANRLGAPRLRVMEIEADSAEAAKVQGALINIGEGSGTAVDAAKVMRSQGLTAEQLRAQGVPLSGAVARDGLALSNLEEGLFSLVARGRLSVPRGAIIGRSGLTAPQQTALFQLLEAEEAKGKELTNGQVEELAKFVRGSESGSSSQETLFGTETVDMSLAIEKAKLSSWVKGELRKTAAAFREAARRGRAETLAKAGVGSIDAAKARELAGDAEVVLEVYDRLSASAGPVSDVLNRGVRELQEGAKPDEVKASVLSQVAAAVEEALAGGAREGVPAGSEGAPSVDPGQEALFDERGRYEVDDISARRSARNPEQELERLRSRGEDPETLAEVARLRAERDAAGRRGQLKVMGGEVSNRNRTAKKLEATGFGRMQVDVEFDPYHGEPWAIDNAAFRQWNERRKELGLTHAEFIARGSPGVEYDRTRFYELYARALKIAQGGPSKAPQFAVIPDQVGDAEGTLMDAGTFLSDLNYERAELLSAEAQDIIEADPWATRGLRYSSVPLYLPVQNGMTPEQLEQAGEPGGMLYDVERDRSFLEDVAGIFLGGDDAYKAETAEAWTKWAHSRGMKMHYARAGTARKLRHAYQVGADSVDSALPQRNSRTWRAFTGELERLEGQLRLLDERGEYKARDPFPARGGRFYSRLERAINRAPMEKATPEQWLGYLDPSQRGFSSSEEEWVDLRAAIQDAEERGKVLKAKLLAAVQGQGIALTEKVRGQASEKAAELGERAEALQAIWRNRIAELTEEMEKAGYAKELVEDVRHRAIRPSIIAPGVIDERLYHDVRLAERNLIDLLGRESIAGGTFHYVAGASVESQLAAARKGKDAKLTGEQLTGYLSMRRTKLRAAAAGLAAPGASDVRFDRDLERLKALEDAAEAWNDAKDREFAADSSDPPEAVQKAWTEAKTAFAKWDQARYELRQEQAKTQNVNYPRYSVGKGQEGYTEITISLEPRESLKSRKLNEEYQQLAGQATEQQRAGNEPLPPEMLERLRAIDVELAGLQERDYDSPHWQEENVLVHTRYTTHNWKNPKTGDTEKVLLVNEIQSDWHQQGRKRGYGPQIKWGVRHIEHGHIVIEHDTREGAEDEVAEMRQPEDFDVVPLQRPNAGVPDAPFKATGEWVELALKRIIDEAVTKGFDRVAILNGRNVARLFGLSQEIERLELVPATYIPTDTIGLTEEEAAAVAARDQREKKVWILTALTTRGDTKQHSVTTEQLPDYVGAAVAKALLEQDPIEPKVVKRPDHTRNGNLYHVYDVINAATGASLIDTDGQSMTGYYREQDAEDAARRVRDEEVRALNHGELAGLEMGGEGERGFYDDLVPKEAQKYLRAIKGPKLERIEGVLAKLTLSGIEEVDERLNHTDPLWSFPITQGMRELVHGEGQRLMDRDDAAEWQRRLGSDLFGSTDPSKVKQESLLPEKGAGAIQGISEAAANARALVSALEGRVTRGAASAEDTRRYNEAKALLRRLEGKGIDPRELEPTKPEAKDPYTGDLFGEAFKEPTGAHIQAELQLVFGSLEKATEVNLETLKRAGPFADIIMPGVRDASDRIAAVRRGKAAFVKVDAVGKVVGSRKAGIDKEAVLRLLQSYRHPAAEFLHTMVVVDGRVVHHRLTTAGSFDTAIVNNGDAVEAAAIAARLGGTVIMAHNHPSGDPKPSPEDLAVQREAEKIFARLGARSGGHYVINHYSAVHIDILGNTNRLDLATDKGDWNDPRSRSIGGPQDAAQYFGKLPHDGNRLDVLLLDNRYRTVAFEARPIEDLDTAAEWLPGLRREAAAPYVILGVSGAGNVRLAASILNDIPLSVIDIVEVSGKATAVELGIFSQTAGPVTGLPVHEERGRYEVPDREGEAARPGRIRAPALDVTPRLGAADPRSISGLRDQFSRIEPDPAVVAGGVVPDERLDAPIAGTTLRPISPVELTRLAFELLGSQRDVFVKRVGHWYGAFFPYPGAAKIGLSTLLGKDYEKFAQTLAHEIGHAIDFFPDETMARGNLLGRLANLKRYLRETIDALPSNPSNALTSKDRARLRREAEKLTRAAIGKKPSSAGGALDAWNQRVALEYKQLVEAEMAARGLIGLEKVTEELILVSEWWRGTFQGSGGRYEAYRRSPQELYADALSVLLNSPGSLQQRAPTFFDALLAYLERKPDFKAIYEGIQADIAGGEEHLMGVRREQLDEDVDRGEQIRKELEDRPDPQGNASYFEQLLSSSAAPATRAEKNRVKPKVAQDVRLEVKHALQELNHSDNVNRLMLSDIVRLVDEPLKKVGLGEKDAHEYLLMTRVAYGDRGGMAEEAKEDIMARTGLATWAEAREEFKRWETEDPMGFDPELLERAESGILNPRGYTPDEAKRNLDNLERKLGPDKWKVLEDAMGEFREILFRSVTEAVRVGSYNSMVYQTKLLPNSKHYATFSVLEYFDGRVPAGVKRQIGTVKAVGSTYTSSILKAMALNRLNELQRAKQAVLGVLDVDFPGSAGPIRQLDKFHREKPASPGKENFFFLQNGRAYYREVDPYIARMFDRLDIGSLARAANTLGMRTYQVFHPLYVTLSIAWQARNTLRDWQRTYQNLATAHAGKPTYRQALDALLDVARLGRSYTGALGASWRHAKQKHDPVIREMIEDKALGRAFHSFDPIGETTMERLAQRYGLVGRTPGKFQRAAEKVLPKPVTALGGWAAERLERWGVFQETLAKVAAWKYLTDQGITGRERAYIVRNYTGTPDSRLSGLASEATNAIFLYSNVTIAGLRADLEVATQPATAGGWWFRGLLTNFMPKFLMAAAVFGWLDGDDDDDEEGMSLSEWYRHVPSYDLEKFLIVPLPPFVVRNERGETKAVYLRWPHMDTDRALAGVLWAMFVEDRPHAIPRGLGVGLGEAPSLSPAIDLARKNAFVIGGINPVDYFYGRPIIPRTEWEAGGWPRYRELLRYDLQQLGIISQLLGRWVYNSPEESEAAPGEKMLRTVPGLSSLVKISDRGLNEERYYEQEYDTQARARIRADLAPMVRRALSERSNLNRLGVENLDDRELERRAALNAWYSQVYIPQTEAIEFYRDQGDAAARAEAGRVIEAELEAILNPGG